MNTRWIDYAAAHEQVAAAFKAADRAAGEAEQFMVAELEAGRLKGRADAIVSRSGGAIVNQADQLDIPTVLWKSWRLCPYAKNGGPDFSWSDADNPKRIVRTIVRGLTIETYGLEVTLAAISPAPNQKPNGAKRGRPKKWGAVVAAADAEIRSLPKDKIATLEPVDYENVIAAQAKSAGLAETTYLRRLAGDLRRRIKTDLGLIKGSRTR